MGICSHCKQIRQVIDGKIVNHSWPLPFRALCPGSGKIPDEH